DGMLDVQITGAEEQFTLSLHDGLRGKELLTMVRDRLPVKPRCTVQLWTAEDRQAEQKGEVILNQTLKEQGLGTSPSLQLSYSYASSDLWHAFKILEGEVVREVDHHALDGVVHVQYAKHLIKHVTLPPTLESLKFGDVFYHGVDRLALPSKLVSLAFGRDFDQALDGMVFPESLRHLTFGREFNQSLEEVDLPKMLESLVFGDNFNQSLDNVPWRGVAVQRALVVLGPQGAINHTFCGLS
ncbi:Probable inactive serine/threonine-protein kinase fnkC, partial [Durusdinium trenchii]